MFPKQNDTTRVLLQSIKRLLRLIDQLKPRGVIYADKHHNA